MEHHRWFCNQFSPFFPVLHCPLGLAKLQASPSPDVVFPPLPLSAMSSSPFHCALQDGFGQIWWTGNITIPLQFAFLYDGQEVFVWSNCLLDLCTDFLVGNMVFVCVCMRCVLSCGSTSFAWCVFFFGALLWGSTIHTHPGRWMWQGSTSVVSWSWEKYSRQSDWYDWFQDNHALFLGWSLERGSTVQTVPAGSPSHGGDVAVLLLLLFFVINQLSLPTPFYFVFVSVSVFMALSTVFHSINSPDSSSLSHSSPSLSFCLSGPFDYISLYETLLQPWYDPLWLTGLRAPNYLTNCTNPLFWAVSVIIATGSTKLAFVEIKESKVEWCETECWSLEAGEFGWW